MLKAATNFTTFFAKMYNLDITKWKKGGFRGDSAIKNQPVMQEMQETQVWSLDWEDPPE